MPKDNSKFFEKKMLWSEIKDELLGCYLRPYVPKALKTKVPVYYVDCFAGKGRFKDGHDGSPLIALKTFDEACRKSSAADPSVSSCFIDLNYASDLYMNLAGYHDYQIVSGRYEDKILQLLDSHRYQNIFLYIDPYGIKALDCDLFDTFADGRFRSIEMLINMNSFGFLREACRALKASQKVLKEFDLIINDELTEYDASRMDASEQSIHDLTKIAGGEFWMDIVNGIINGTINCFDAEKLFAKGYCNRLLQRYKYVLNMPIRLKKGQQPKYRMIHVTNHSDGCVLMYENICKRWEALEELQNGGQLSFLTPSIEGEHTDIYNVKQMLQTHLRHYRIETRLNQVLANFVVTHGVLCQKAEIISMLRSFESKGFITIKREPANTNMGKASIFMTENQKQRVWIRCVK